MQDSRMLNVDGNNLPEQHGPIELSMGRNVLLFTSVLSDTVTSSHVWLLSTGNVASVIGELHFKLDWIVVNLNSPTCWWLLNWIAELKRGKKSW